MVDHKKISHHRTALFWIEPEKIKVLPGLNARDLTTPDNIEHVRRIADSMKASGFLESEPLECSTFDGDLTLTAGHCRLAAVVLARSEGWNCEFVPYIPESKGTDEVQRIVNQRTSNMGKALTPLEESHNVKRLMGLGLELGEIARRTARSVTYIEQLLALQAMPVEVKAMVANKEIAAKVAVDTIKEIGQSEGSKVLQESVTAARGKGKTKASPKDVRARLEARDDTKRFRCAWKPKTRLLGVRIGNTEFAFSAQVWLDMAEKIASTARGFIEPVDDDTKAQKAEDAAFLEGRPPVATDPFAGVPAMARPLSGSKPAPESLGLMPGTMLGNEDELSESAQ